MPENPNLLEIQGNWVGIFFFSFIKDKKALTSNNDASENKKNLKS